MVELHQMKRLSIAIAALAVALCLAADCGARPKKGFHTGPYILLEGGIIGADNDTDVAANEKVGNDIEPSVGFLFGWNLWDELSTELQGRYATNFNHDRRTHIASGNVYAKWTFITDALTDFESLRILPFAKCGLSFRASILPGSRNSTKNTTTQFGVGPSPGAGIAFLWKKYFYFGVDVQGDLLFFNEIDQTVSGVPGTRVYDGGFHPSVSAMGMVGVHY
jgi:hypothetical protein